MKNNIIKKFEIFLNIVRHSNHVFRQYCLLYENSKQRLSLLEEIAHHFFYDVQGMWIERIFLDICKLTDPAMQFNNKNMTLDHWLKELDRELTDTEKGKIEASMTICIEKRDKVVKARRKVIAHIDYEVAIGKGALGKIEKEEIEEFYSNIEIILDILSRKLERGAAPLRFAAQKDADDLIKSLKKAIHYDHIFESNPNGAWEERKKWKYKDA
ncbi:MAG: hypothetical protein WA126_10955 [Thermodesulfovibrionales bacterium]